MKPILEIKSISKKFRINHEQQPYLSLRDSLAKMFRNKTSTEDFWALRDVSFEVMPGDTLGIIGKNGAGKSTLLKILSKITPPTSGSIIGRGRIASLLEVGTGFHPELSGRENIFMNGSILGMRKSEIHRNFDAIVDFAGVEKFIDTPLKHYSSGMQLRLAFAVAAFLENEILIIDEVLAVGDAEFQKKCLGKMEDVSKSGRTLLFVSHNLNSLQTICDRSILLKNGSLIRNGTSYDVIADYLSSENYLSENWSSEVNSKEVYIDTVNTNLNGEQPNLKLKIDVKITSKIDMLNSFIAFNISNSMGQMIGQSIPQQQAFIKLNRNSIIYSFVIYIDGFVPDDYFLSVWIGPHFSHTYDWVKEVVKFKVLNSPQVGRTFPHPYEHGFIVPKSEIISS